MGSAPAAGLRSRRGIRAAQRGERHAQVDEELGGLGELRLELRDLALDRAAWAPRWAKGEQMLLDHTISGFNGMPAGGQCFSCSADDYRALIRFMAGHGA